MCCVYVPSSCQLLTIVDDDRYSKFLLSNGDGRVEHLTIGLTNSGVLYVVRMPKISCRLWPLPHPYVAYGCPFTTNDAPRSLRLKFSSQNGSCAGHGREMDSEEVNLGRRTYRYFLICTSHNPASLQAYATCYSRPRLPTLDWSVSR